MATSLTKKDLIFAAKYGHLDKVIEALDAGVDVNASSKHGGTALTLAARRGHVGIIQHLLAQGADVNVLDAHPLTALRWASNPDVVRLLLDHGADVTHHAYGHTALSRALQRGYAGIVEQLRPVSQWVDAHPEAVTFSRQLNVLLGHKAGYPPAEYTGGDFRLSVGAAREEKDGNASIRLSLFAPKGDNVAAFAGHVAERLGEAFEGMQEIKVMPDYGNYNHADIVLTHPAKDFGRFDERHVGPMLLDWLQDEYANIKDSMVHCVRNGGMIEYPDQNMHRRRLESRGDGVFEIGR